MKIQRTTMGMPAMVEIVDQSATEKDIEAIFAYFQQVDERFSTYKPTSEISLINSGQLSPAQYSDDLQEILQIAEQTKQETAGYFNVMKNNYLDPSGIVKGWAIGQAGHQLRHRGFKNFYIDIGSDIEVAGHNSTGEPWRIGIRDPFHTSQIIKILSLTDCGIATSGSYERGQHIYNPHQPDQKLIDIVSLTVIGSHILDADRLATAAFAMGVAGITFLETQPGFAGYMIDKDGQAYATSNFHTRTLTI